MPFSSKRIPFVLLVCTSCHGQNDTRVQSYTTHRRNVPLHKQAKIVRTAMLGNTIGCSLLDTHGNLWFGTRGSGLCRYDGTSFTDFAE